MNHPSLTFGIPSLDRLLSGSDSSLLGVSLDSSAEKSAISLCISGSDGVGKSLLGLHLAAQYAAQTDSQTKILYVSTDLSHEKAMEIWENFKLNNLKRKTYHFEANDFITSYGFINDEVNLTPLTLFDANEENSESVAKYIMNEPKKELFGLQIAILKNKLINEAINSSVIKTKIHNMLIKRMIEVSAFNFMRYSNKREVGYINLKEKTAGDDWGYLNRIIANLNEIKENQKPHLIVIDAVEGLEFFMGENDFYGNERSRRSRIAQILRTAGKKCHVVFMVEESKDGGRLPEEFVTDVVIHLGRTEKHHFTRRFIEVMKARGQKHVRGPHYFIIRSQNTKPEKPENQYYPDEPKSTHAYIYVYHSLHSLTDRQKANS